MAASGRRIALGIAAAGLGAAAVNHVLARAAEARHAPQGRFHDVDGLRLHAVERGTGPPVLYLHGNGAMIQEIAATGLIEAIARGHRLIAVDRPGFGHSSRPRGSSWTPGRQADAVAALLDRLGAAPALVMAHSWGTLVAVALAIHHPRHVRGLVLMSGYYYPTRRLDRLLGMMALPVLGDAVRHTVAPLAARLASPLVVRRMFSPNRVTGEFRAQYPVALAVRPSQLRAFAEEAGCMAKAAAELAPGYRQIACPTLILAGSEDRVVDSEEQSVRLGRDIPGAEVVVLDGVGHMLPHMSHISVQGALARIETATDPGAQPGPRQLVPPR